MIIALFKTTRFAMALIFLWAFFDKTFGLGFSTSLQNAWINGGSPTTGFLANATYGPFSSFFKELAGVPMVDWLFMLGLLGVGISLLFNLQTRLGVLAGSLMLALMYLSAFPPKTNPFIDDHIVYILVLMLIANEKKIVEISQKNTS